MVKTPKNPRLTLNPLSSFSPNKLFRAPSPDPPGKGSRTGKPAMKEQKRSVMPLESRDCLEDSVRRLHRGVEEARVDGMAQCLDEAIKQDRLHDGEGEGKKDTVSLLNMFNRLEKQHSDEKSDWDKHLQQERDRKSTYKTQLKSAYKEKLTWLENQLQKVGETNCSQGKEVMFAEGKVLFASSSDESARTASSSSTCEQTRGSGQIRAPIVEQESSSNVLSPSSLRKVQKLEQALHDTLRQYESDRAVWVKALEDAATVTQAGEKLSTYQEQLLCDLKKQLADEQKQHKKKWKEQNNVLKELLTLTETQFQQEKQGWERQNMEYQKNLAKVNQQARDNEERLTLELDAMIKKQKSLLADSNTLEHSLKTVQDEKAGMSRQILQLQKNLTETIDNRGDVASVGNLRAASSPRRIEWDDRLDRAMIERDLYKQEANQAAENLYAERKKWEEHSEEALKSVRKEAIDRLEKERKTFEEKLEAKDNECNEIRNGWETERLQWAEKNDMMIKEWEKEIRNQIEELQKIHAAELSEVQSSDHELAEKYREAVEKKNEIALRLRLIEQQRSEEKGTWKLQLEGALSESRRAAMTVQQLKKEIVEERKCRSLEMESLRDELTRSRLILSGKDIHDAQPSVSSEHIMKLYEQLEKAREFSECQLAMTRETHARDIQRLTGELEILESQNSALVSELKRQKKIKNEVNEEGLLMKKTHDSLSAEFSLAIERKDAEIKKFKSKVEELECARDNVEQDVIDLAAKLDCARKETKQAKEKLNDTINTSEMEAAKKDAEEILCKLKEQKHEIEKHLHEALEEKTELAERNLELTEQIGNSKEHLEKLLEKLSEIELFDTRQSDCNSRPLAVIVESLEKLVDSLKSQHALSKKRLELEIERLSTENQDLRVDKAVGQQHTRLQSTVEELREDVVSIREIMETSHRTDRVIGESDFGTLRANLEQIQNNLDDVAGEAALQTESIYEFRKIAEDHLKEAGTRENGAFVELHHALLSEMAGLRNGLAKVIQNQKTKTPTKDLDRLKEELSAEVSRRQENETEIRTLNEQASAYAEELMHLQAENAKLETLLQEAEAKVTYALSGGPQQSCDAESFTSESIELEHVASYSEDSALLDEALALAQGLSDIVQGNDNNGNEINVLEIIENLADMIDGQDLSDDVAILGKRKNLARSKPDWSRKYPSTVSKKSNDRSRQSLSTNDPSLTIFIEQLYGRCQVLERERLEMMELTLDLLESTRRSGKAEVDAALATARRRTADDFRRMRDENFATREALYHQVCSSQD